MATKTLRVFAEYTSTGFVPMPTAGNIDYGYTLGSTFPATTPTTFQTDNPDLVVTVTAMTDFYVWIRVNGQAWNPSYTRNVRVYPDSPNINNVVMNMIIATGPAGVSSYTQIVQTSNRLYFNGATTDSVYNSKFAGKTYINELNFGTAPGLATVATSGAYADLTGKPSLATVATSGLFTDLSSKPSGTAPLSYNSGTNSFVITQANTSTNGFLSSTDWNTFNNKFATPAGTTLQYVDGTGALQTFPVLASADKLVINVRNSSGVSMPKGSVVYINGATGNKPTVALAQANSDASSAQTLGLLQATLANNAEGNVVIVGSVIDLNTSAFTEGQQLYLSPTTAGTYTATKQYAPNHLVYVGVVTRSHVSLGTIDVKVQNGYEMDELHNVSAQSPSNNDGLFYNTTTSLWEKKSIATVLGYTPYNGTDTSIKALFSASAPLSYSNGVYGISQATTSSNGYLSSTDWNTFNGKESALTFSIPLVRTTNTISINQASASTSGYLSSTDWNTFNNKGSGSGSVTSVAMSVPTGLSISGTPITTSGTLALSLTAGYVIPTTSSASNWDSAYTNRITSLTVTGSSGSATLASNVLNIPTYTLVGLGGQVALNGTGFVKISGTTISYDNSTYLTTASASSTYQTIITNPVTGTGTTNTIAYWTSASAIGALALATYPSLTELAYVKGVTSAIQTQLDAKASTLSGTTNYIPKFTSSSAIGNSNLINDASGNLGLAVTPSAWSSTIKVLQIGTSTSLWDQGGILGLTNNVYIDDVSNKYITTGFATRYFQNSGSHIWTTAPSGTAGTAITHTERFRIANDGNIGINVTPPTWYSNFKGLNLPNGSFVGYTTNGSIFLTQNSYFNAAGSWIYINTGTAGQYSINGAGEHLWYTATSGTAGASTTLVERLKIANTGAATFSSSVTASNIYLGSGTFTSSYSIDAQNTVTYARLKSTGSNDAAFIVQDGNYVGYIGLNVGSNPNNMVLYFNGNTALKINTSGGATFSSTIQTGGDISLMNSSGDISFRIKDSGGNADRVLTRQATTNDVYIGDIDANSGRAIIRANGNDAIIIATNGNTFIQPTATSNNTGLFIQNNNTGGYGSSLALGLYGYAQSAYFNPLRIEASYPGYGQTNFIVKNQANSSEIVSMSLPGGGNVLIGTTSDAGYKLYVSGAIYATSNITANSDLTLKKNLKLIDNPIDKLMQLNGYAYQWKSDDSHQYGVIAQEVEKILPYAVSTGNDGIKGVSYNQIIPVLIEAIKVQNKRIVELESKIA